MFALAVCIACLGIFSRSLACYGGADIEMPTEVTSDVGQSFIKDQAGSFLGGYGVSNETMNKWNDWLTENIMKHLTSEKRNLTLELEEERANGWPYWSWKDFGVGYEGLIEPPPWSWVAKPVDGLPADCFLDLDGGTNKLVNSTVKCFSTKRWAYNPYKKDCQIFTYQGCGGNANNFGTLEACTTYCMKQPQGGCDPNTMIEFMSGDLETEESGFFEYSNG